MQIHRHLRIILLSTCLSQSLAMGAIAIDTQPKNTNAANSTVSKDDLSAQKELFQMQLDAKNELIQLQLDTKQELLQKDIEAQAKRIDAFEKRIDDQTSRISDIGSGVDRFGVIVSFFGTLVTVLLVMGGVWGYRTAKSDAKETAKEAASQWFNDNHISLNSQIDELKKRVAQASENIDVYEEKVAKKSNEFNAMVDALFETQMENIQRQLSQSTAGEKSEKQSPKDNSAIEQKAEKLKQLPEIEYTFTDWNTRAFAAYSEGNPEAAIFYWDKAISSLDIQPQAQAQTMFYKGVTLDQLNRNEEAIAVYDAIITQFGTAEELDIREPVAKAMVNKGFRLDQLNRNEEAIVIYDAVITQFGTAGELILREAVAQAMVNKGITLTQLDRNEEAIAVHDAVINKFSTEEELSLRKPVANAMVNKGITLGKLNHNEEAIAAYDAVITQFGTAEKLSLREPVANAMVNKGFILGKLNRNEEAIATYNAAIIQFGIAKELSLQEQVAKAMINKGVTLDKLNRNKEAIAAYDAVIARFGTAEELSLREQVAKAMSNKGFSLLCEAKANWENPALAKELLVNANNICNLAIMKKSDSGIPRGNLAYITWLQGDAAAAEQHFKTGLTAATHGGENLYKATLTDFEIHPIAPDHGFRELVEKLWAEYKQSVSG